MPVQLGLNVQRGAGAPDFGSAIGASVANAGEARAKKTLAELQRYIRTPNGGSRAGYIRIVNTTNNDALSFRYKSGGWSQQYRKDRTADALVALLDTAGVHDARSIVDELFMDKGRYGRVDANRLSALFANEAVRSALEPPANPLSPSEQHPAGDVVYSQPGGVVQAQPSPATGVNQQPVAPIQDNDPAKVPARPEPSPADLARQARDKFEKVLQPLSLKLFASAGLAREFVRGSPTFFRGTVAESGRRAEFRNLSDHPVTLAPGESFSELGYEDFNRENPNLPDEFKPPTYAFVRRPEASGEEALAFHCVNLNALPDEFQNTPLQVWATVTEGEVDPQAKPRAAAIAQVEANKAVMQPRAPAGQRKPADLIAALKDQLGLEQDGQMVGKGGFGAVFPAQYGGGPVMLKLLIQKDQMKPEIIDGQRAGPDEAKLSEAYAAYLDKSRDAQWQKPNVVTPTHYLVEHDDPAGPRYEAIPAANIKQRARNREDAPDGLKCVGLIMPRAPGDNLSEKLKNGPLTDAEFRSLAKSGLTTARALNARGWVHRDLKPANMNLDDHGTHVFDTGLGYKFKKTAQQRQQAEGRSVPQRRNGAFMKPPLFRGPQPGTMGYMHPASGTGIGTQIDLHAWALIFLESRFPALRPGYTIADSDAIGIQGTLGYGELRPTLDQLQRQGGDVAVQAANFKAEMARDGTAAHFIAECLRYADSISATEWADRQKSDKWLAELQQHPAIR